MNNSSYSEIAGLISNAGRIVVAGHVGPDGDAISAALSLCMCIGKLGKKPYALLEEYAERYGLIKGREFLYAGSIDLLSPDLFISVDCGDIKRLGNAEEVFHRAAKTVNIDHHLSNNYFADYNIVDARASSASELIYGLISHFGNMDKDIAAALYAGIAFDTGGFRHSSTGPRTMEIAADLIRFGIPFTDIYGEILLSHSITEARIFAKAISKMEITGTVVHSTVSLADMAEVFACPKDLENIVEFMMDTRGARAAIFAYEKQGGEVKVSLRSRSIDVSQTALFFGGGGHLNAAGCSFFGTSLSEALETVLSHVKKELDE